MVILCVDWSFMLTLGIDSLDSWSAKLLCSLYTAIDLFDWTGNGRVS